MEHVPLVSRRYWSTGVWQAMGGFAIWQDMAVLVILQRSVLRGVRESVERGRHHMLGGKMVVLLVVHHARRGEVAERRRVLMETRRHHDWWKWKTLGRLHHAPVSRKQRSGSRVADGARWPSAGRRQDGGEFEKRHGLTQPWKTGRVEG